MSSYFSKNSLSRLRSIPLDAVLQAASAVPDPHDRHKWHTSHGHLSITGAKFINWNQNFAAGGAIDLAMHLNSSSFKDAVSWLAQLFPEPNSPPTSTTPNQTKRTLTLPQNQPFMLPLVLKYLTSKRSLPRSLLNPLVLSGSIYADNHANAVFLLRQNETPVGAELRSTTHNSWKGLCPGSRRNLGFFSCSAHTHSSGIILVESAIDAISCSALNPHLLCISTAGARPAPTWLTNLFSLRLPIYCGFDNDPAGEHSAAEMLSLYPQVSRLPPPQHDWNDSLPCNQ